MARFPNTMQITEVEFKQNIQCMCPLGGAFCTYQVTVSMQPGAVIPDYCEVEKFFRNMSGSTLTIEDAVFEVFDYLCQEYEPHLLEVKIYCDDAVHFPVTVTKIL